MDTNRERARESAATRKNEPSNKYYFCQCVRHADGHGLHYNDVRFEAFTLWLRPDPAEKAMVRTAMCYLHGNRKTSFPLTSQITLVKFRSIGAAARIPGGLHVCIAITAIADSFRTFRRLAHLYTASCHSKHYFGPRHGVLLQTGLGQGVHLP